MAQFSYSDYTTAVEKAKSGSSTPTQKVGFFKLKNDMDQALVRIDCSTIDELDFASVHTISSNGKWTRVSCLNELGSHTNDCPLCEALAAGDTSISKPAKRVYVRMIASYFDKATQTWTAPQPVVWERPAGFSRELANKLRDYGDLRKVLLKVTRNGAAGDMQTTYSLDYAVPTVFKPEMVPEDFSAFENFKISKHSFWEKTAEEIKEFLKTGEFPSVKKETTATEAPVQQVVAQPAVETVKVEEPKIEEPKPSSNSFSGFSF